MRFAGSSVSENNGNIVGDTLSRYSCVNYTYSDTHPHNDTISTNSNGYKREHTDHILEYPHHNACDCSKKPFKETCLLI